MYTLYFKREDRDIQVRKAKKALQNWNYTEEVTRYNDCYYICSTRNPLVEKAEEIRKEWIAELEENLRKVKELKV